MLDELNTIDWKNSFRYGAPWAVDLDHPPSEDAKKRRLNIEDVTRIYTIWYPKYTEEEIAQLRRTLFDPSSSGHDGDSTVLCQMRRREPIPEGIPMYYYCYLDVRIPIGHRYDRDLTRTPGMNMWGVSYVSDSLHYLIRMALSTQELILHLFSGRDPRREDRLEEHCAFAALTSWPTDIQKFEDALVGLTSKGITKGSLYNAISQILTDPTLTTLPKPILT